ncbi:MAG TPA: Rieske 2Fe-2S domain-containing protein [Capsulimonadaceae bacterium]
MGSKAVVKAIEGQEWLEPVADAVQGAVGSIYKAGGEPANGVKNMLHGVWLGHPIHPIKASVVIGAWTVAAFLDAKEAMGDERVAPGADAAVAVGIAAAIGSAITGLTDYTGVDDKPRKRVGAMHAIVNGSATLLYGASFLCRRSGHRSVGRALAALGYGLVGVGGFLGGTLAYEQNVGIDHADREDLPQKWTAVGETSEIGEGANKVFMVGKVPILVANQNGTFYAIGNTCAHLGGPLNEGKFENGTVTCPWHGSCVKLEDGEVVNGPSIYPQPTFDVRVRNGHIELRASQTPNNAV